MNTCSSCGDQFNDGVQCTACMKWLDFSCAQLTEVGWRRLGEQRRSDWKCPTCRSSPLPSPTSNPISMDILFTEIRELKQQLTSLPALIEGVRVVKDELRELKNSNEFISNKLDEFSKQMSDIQKRMKKFDKLDQKVHSLEADVLTLKSNLSDQDQRSRLNNVEIKGVPLKKGENLFSIVESICKTTGTGFCKSQINFLHRSPLHGTNEKSIIVSFLNRYVKDEFIASARSYKDLSAADLGYTSAKQRVYVNDHLNGALKMLLNKTKSKTKDTNYKYVWVKHGKIHVRKSDTSPVLIIANELDLNKLI